MKRRWDGDTRGRGVGDGRRLVGGADELVRALEASDWVAEQPEEHLLPHLERATARPASPFVLEASRAEPDGAFVVELAWRGAPGDLRAIRAGIYALVGEVAESATYVRQRRDGEALSFEVATGLLEPDTQFASHGHVLVLHVQGAFAGPRLRRASDR
jgi:hypothetical protein